METGADKHLAEFKTISDALVAQTIDKYQSWVRNIPERLEVDRQITIIDIGHVSLPDLLLDDQRHPVDVLRDIRGQSGLDRRDWLRA